MQIAARPDAFLSGRQSRGLRAMVLTGRPDGQTATRLASYGCLVETRATLPAALASLAEDRIGYDLFAMDCDGFGGVHAAEKALAALIAAQARMRVMLVSAGFDTPAYPMGQRTAVCLPDTVQDHDFRYGFDHALRDHVPPQMM